MKLVAGRQYKKDLSDIIGIILEQNRAEKPLNYEMIDNAMIKMYGSWDKVSSLAKEVLINALESENLEELFIEQSEDEQRAKETILEIDRKYPKLVNQNNIDDVIAAALAKKNKN
jgi:hypothetical protein